MWATLDITVIHKASTTDNAKYSERRNKNYASETLLHFMQLSVTHVVCITYLHYERSFEKRNRIACFLSPLFVAV